MTPSLTHLAVAAALGAGAITGTTGAAAQASAPMSAPTAAAYDELFNLSLTQKKGLSVYVGGQVVVGVFVKRIDTNTIELRSQQFAKIIVRLDRVDAIALS
jgi:histidine ammonia-lyase